MLSNIYYAVKLLTLLWLGLLMYVLLFGGRKSETQDRYSKYVMMLTLGAVPPLIKYTTDQGAAATGAFAWGVPFINYAGFALFFAGLAVHLAGIITLKKQWSNAVSLADGHQLIESGIYHSIRHPIYAGLLLELFGFGLALSNWHALAWIVVPNLLSVFYRVHVEEAALIRHFGEAYRQYSRRTKRFIPWVV